MMEATAMLRRVFTCLTDPYLHLIGIALLLFRLAAVAPSEQDMEVVSPALLCNACKAWHSPEYSCPRQTSFLARLLPGEGRAN